MPKRGETPRRNPNRQKAQTPEARPRCKPHRAEFAHVLLMTRNWKTPTRNGPRIPAYRLRPAAKAARISWGPARQVVR